MPATLSRRFRMPNRYTIRTGFPPTAPRIELPMTTAPTPRPRPVVPDGTLPWNGPAYNAARLRRAPACTTSGTTNPLRHPAKAPAAMATTMAMSITARAYAGAMLIDGSRRGMGGIKLDEVSGEKGYDRRAFLKVMGLGASAAALAACGGGAGTTAVATTAAATQAAATTAAAVKPTGTVVVYSALNETTNKQFSAAVKAAYPGSDIDL